MRLTTTGLVSGALAFGFVSAALADGYGHGERFDFGLHGRSFNRIATFANYTNRANPAEGTVSEIVAATADGNTLVYTDATSGSIGFVGIHNPRIPVPLGTLALGGEPTSVDMLGNRLALVGVNTSDGDYDNPTGHLAVVDIEARTILAELDLGGQPDSVKVSPDGRYAAIAIENERDEDEVVNGEEGGLPQVPAGFLAIVDITGSNPANWGARAADLTGLSAYAPDDPEPEFVDVNKYNEAVVTMQENNHVVIVDLASGGVVADFGAGSVDLDRIDTEEEDVISLDSALDDVPREPDGVTWIPGFWGGYTIGTANEGDLFGGSRGFSIFSRDGAVLFDSGSDFEHEAVRIGHYPEARSENKGSEPESIEHGRFGYEDYLFVGSERGSFVGVYKLDWMGRPRHVQSLPAPLGPEGLLAIPARNLLIASGEEDDPTFGVRSTMMIYELGYGRPDYPQIVSDDDVNGTPIPWSALSGMIAKNHHELLAVWDSYYAESRIFTIDASRKPAVITDAVTILGGTGDYDPEGIAIAPDGTYWIASEGNAGGSRPNRLLQTDKNGVLLAEIGLPPEIEACRAASSNTSTLGSGFEGVAVLRTWHSYKLLVAQQRGWDYTTPGCEDLDDDDGGFDAHGQPNWTRIWIYDPKSGSWDYINWELAPLPQNASWVGLSEITEIAGGAYVVIERDNRTGDWAELKTLARFRVKDAFDGLVGAADKSVYDLIPKMESTDGWITDKPEGVAVTRSGETFVVTDNDGVDDWSGETSFLRLGNIHSLFRRWR